MNNIERFLHYNLISSLTTDDLWLQFLSAISEELELIKSQIYKSKVLYNYKYQQQDGIIDLSEMFGYTPNLIIDNSLDMLKREYESIPYRIRNKTTYDGYYIIFKLIEELGEIYNYYWTGEKLIKALNFDETISKLDDFILTNPFINIIPDKNFSVISDGSTYRLDTNLILDKKFGNKVWTFDENTSISPTKHLGIEYYADSLIIKNNEEYIITSEYINYLLEGVMYTKRVPIVPHVGIQLTGITYENGSNNYFNPDFSYSIPKLKLNICITFNYTKNFADKKKFFLDNGFFTDETILWNLDNSIENSNLDMLDKIKYISCGTGTLSTPSNDNINIFDYTSMVLYYSFDDGGDTDNITDFSINQYNAKVYGQTKKVNGVIGKTVNFNGETYVKSDNPIRFLTENLSIGFWLKIYNSENETYFIFDYDVFKMWYSLSEQKLYYSLSSLNGSIDNIKVDTLYHIIVEIDITNGQLRIYIDTNLIKSESLQGFYMGEYNLYIGSDLNTNNKFIGIIDSLWLMTKIYSQKDKEYIFSKKLGILTHLSNKLAEYEIDEQEKFSNSKWLAIFSYVTPNNVVNEFAFSVNGDFTLNGKSNYPFKKGTLSLRYKKRMLLQNQDYEETLVDNEFGGFINLKTGEKVDGKINYSTGEFSLNRETYFYISNYRFLKSEVFNSEGLYLNFENIKESSFKITYSISDTVYVASDDGMGNISGEGVEGTINYDDGYIKLENSMEIDGEYVIIEFTYIKDLELLLNSPVYIDYITSDNIPITEVGLEDENKQLLAYMTFPKVELLDYNNYLAVNFLIKKL